MRDDKRTNEQLKIELLSQWKLEAESRNIHFGTIMIQMACETWLTVSDGVGGEFCKKSVRIQDKMILWPTQSSVLRPGNLV